MKVAPRETRGSPGRYVRLSPGGTIEGSVVPPGLDMHIASPTPALRAGLRSGRPSGTTTTLNAYGISAQHVRPGMYAKQAAESRIAVHRRV